LRHRQDKSAEKINGKENGERAPKALATALRRLPDI